MAAKADASRPAPGLPEAGVGWGVGPEPRRWVAARRAGSQHHNAVHGRAPITATRRNENPRKSKTDYKAQGTPF
jgi:hypothetical protein